jgi:hypothetical protein
MEKWGVTATPEEHDTLPRTYLVKCFGPRVVPVPAVECAARDTARNGGAAALSIHTAPSQASAQRCSGRASRLRAVLVCCT